MIPRQEALPLTRSGCVIEAAELSVPVFVEGAGACRQLWFRWQASCGATEPDGRSSHAELAVDRGMRVHLCGSAS
jgi:hypothetical protein